MEQFTVRILDRDYRLSCTADEKPALLAAVDQVDRRMRAIREQGKVSSTERIAVFAALNLASASPRPHDDPMATPHDEPEAIGGGAAEAVADPEILRRMQSIDALLDTAFANQERLF